MSTVYFGSLETNEPKSEASLPAKLDVILEKLRLKDAVKDQMVAIKIHLGYNNGYTTVHPLFVRRVVKAVKDAQGRPFVTDVHEAIPTAAARGYTPEVLGCPILPVAGFGDKHFYTHNQRYKNIESFHVAGALADASVLVDLSHVKGHNDCGFGAAFKNLAIGGVTRKTRIDIHNSDQYDPYWEESKCTLKEKHVETCPFGCIGWRAGKLRIVFGLCNQCMRCVEAAKDGCININPVNFESFQEACAFSTREVLSRFDKDKIFFINLALDITPYCDCWGFTTPSIVPDIGILASRDIVAIEQATLDLIAKKGLIEENVPRWLEVRPEKHLHPFQRIHGPLKDPYLVLKHAERLGLGTRSYKIEEVMPSEERRFPPPAKIKPPGLEQPKSS